MSVLEAVIGWLAPPDCLVCGAEGDALCQGCSISVIRPFGERCWRCNSLSLNSRTCSQCRAAGPLSFVWISTNYESVARQLVRKYKFGHLRAASKPLARHMINTFLAANQPLDVTGRNYMVVPVPTATSRLRQRGFGHSELLARTVAQSMRMQYSNALCRLDQSRQLGSKRQDRISQLIDSFAIKHPGRLAGRNILLIDDVLTTGGSLLSAAKIIKQAGAKRVDALVFAKKL